MNQIVIGAAGPFLVAILIYAFRRGRAGMPFLVLTPIAMLLGTLWATAPDLPRLIGRKDLYDRLARDPRTNIFLFHYTIDQTETDSAWWVVAFLAMVASLMLIAWRELHRAETAARRARDAAWERRH